MNDRLHTPGAEPCTSDEVRTAVRALDEVAAYVAASSTPAALADAAHTAALDLVNTTASVLELLAGLSLAAGRMSDGDGMSDSLADARLHLTRARRALRVAVGDITYEAGGPGGGVYRAGEES